MSTKLTGYVWDGCAASGMKLSSVAIMARLADFSNDEGVCWPSIETIARQIGAGMSTVRTAIARLEAEGWLTRKARRQGSRDPFWCRNVLSPSKLREKWDELSLRLSPSVSTYTEKREDPYFKSSYDNVDYSQIPAGFRG
ncbi:helix-turn-helix domain-containing protein [Escherichia coli]|nr:helix-turn-helix domain-containing protein [Escherichia coli]